MVDKLEWVPKNLTVKGNACTCDDKTNKAGKCKRDGDYDELDILTAKTTIRFVNSKGRLKRQMFTYALSFLAYLCF
jgi:hypothetical protein